MRRPGRGPSLTWTCGPAAALVEMVSGISLSQQPVDRSAFEQRQARVLAPRNPALALALADADADAYQAVLAVQRRRGETGQAGRLREGLRAAADPLVSIVETAGEVTRLAADATGQVRGGARGEAKTAAVLAAAVVEAGVSLIELNLAAAPDDPRLARARAIAHEACSDRARALGTS
ncbi:MAG TPA: cyclodeaminase/cyclohydrolase family protein [Solirubrobacteraceae bacterium]